MYAEAGMMDKALELLDDYDNLYQEGLDWFLLLTKMQLSAIQEVERDFGTKVISIVKLADLISYLEAKGTMDEHLAAVKAYRDQYGIA